MRKTVFYLCIFYDGHNNVRGGSNIRYTNTVLNRLECNNDSNHHTLHRISHRTMFHNKQISRQTAQHQCSIPHNAPYHTTPYMIHLKHASHYTHHKTSHAHTTQHRLYHTTQDISHHRECITPYPYQTVSHPPG